MNNRLNNLLILLPVLGVFSISGAAAQNPQQFLPNVENSIQNGINSGLINNPVQDQQLQNRAAQIQSQEQQDMARNGGTLTPQQQAQINKETARLNHNAQRDMRMDNPNASPYGNPYANPNWRPPNGQYPSNLTPQQIQQWQQQQQWRQQQMNSNNPYNPQNNPNENQQYHHHHRPWNQQ